MRRVCGAPGGRRDVEVEVGEIEQELAAYVRDEEGEDDARGEGDERAGVGGDEPEAASGGGHLGEVAEDGGGAGWAGDEGEEPFGWREIMNVLLQRMILQSHVSESRR